jgi:hypothetical protein
VSSASDTCTFAGRSPNRASSHRNLPRVSFRSTRILLRERANPKGTEGGGGRRIPTPQSRTWLWGSGTQTWTRLDQPFVVAGNLPHRRADAHAPRAPEQPRWTTNPTNPANSTLHPGQERPHQRADANALALHPPLAWTATTLLPSTRASPDRQQPNRSRSTLRAGRQAPHHTLTQTPPRSINPSSWTATPPPSR